jgi:hypothetical protein
VEVERRPQPLGELALMNLSRAQVEIRLRGMPHEADAVANAEHALNEVMRFWYSDKPSGMSHTQFRAAAEEVRIKIEKALK